MKNNTFRKVVVGFAGVGVLSFLAWFFLIQNKSSDENFILVSKLKMNPSDTAAWTASNIDYINTNPTNTNPSHYDVRIDLEKVHVLNRISVRRWLKRNSKFICYPDSYEMIANAHHITDSSYIDAIEHAYKTRSMSFQELMDGINNIPLLQDKFENFGYSGYIHFFTMDDEVKYLYDYGIPGEGRYSVPFLRSVREKVRKDLNDPSFSERNIMLTFVEVEYGGIEVIAFKVYAVGGSTTFTEYYNFSTDPTKPFTYKFL